MSADASTAKQIFQRVKPRFRKRNELTEYWVNAAMRHSNKTPAELACALNDGGGAIDTERIRFERYADAAKIGSMDLVSLKRFVANARRLNLLPPAHTGVISPQEAALSHENPEKIIEDRKALEKRWEKTKANLIKALREYSDCIAASSAIDMNSLIVDQASIQALPGDEDEAGYIEEVHISEIQSFENLVEMHSFFSTSQN